jgi:TolB-like protein
VIGRSIAALLILLPLAARAAEPGVAKLAKRPKLAVTEIRAPTGDAQLTALLSEMALTEASASGSFSVIGQSDVAAMLGLERQRQMLGCSDSSECFAEIGGALGADYLLVGTAGQLGALWRIDLKLVEVRKRSVASRAGESIEPKPELLAAAIQRCVRQVMAGFEPPVASGRRNAGWIVAGAGAACLAGGVAFGLLSRSAWSDMKDAEAVGAAAAWTRSRDAVKTRALAADILYGVGLAGAGTGAWLLLGGAPGRAGVVPLPGGAALLVERGF